jgi:hypothetical protein
MNIGFYCTPSVHFFQEDLLSNTPNLNLLEKTAKITTVWTSDCIRIIKTLFQHPDTIVTYGTTTPAKARKVGII